MRKIQLLQARPAPSYIGTPNSKPTCTSSQGRASIFWARFSDGYSYGRKIDSRPEAIQQWLLELKAKCAQGKIDIALEQRRGPLFYQLCSHLEWIDLYPVNPQSLVSFRQTFFSSRAKDDPVDSQLLEALVRSHGDRLRPYQPQPISERKLDQCCRLHRGLLDLATQKIPCALFFSGMDGPMLPTDVENSVRQRVACSRE